MSNDALKLTPGDLSGDLERRVRAHSGPLAIDRLADWPDDALHVMRARLSVFELGHPALVDGVRMTLDDLIESMVAAFARRHPERQVFRLRDPLTWEDADFERFFEVYAPGQIEGWYCVDGEAEVLTPETLYDLYEEALFPYA